MAVEMKLVLVAVLLIFAGNNVECKKKAPKGELQIIVEQESSHCTKQAAKGDTVVVHYTGTLENGMTFDSSRSEQRGPFPVELGEGKVIPGWEEGLLGMCEGEIRKLIVPPHMAYGEQGHPPVIPKDATLTFVIECLEIKKHLWSPFSSGTRQFLFLVGVIGVAVYLVYEVIKKARKEQDEEKKRKKERKEKASNRLKNPKKGK